MRALAIFFVASAIAGQVHAQAKVEYRTVELPTGHGVVGIEFTIPLPDSLAAQRIREAAERRKLDLGREERGATYLGKTLPGLCGNSTGFYLPPGTPAPTGPCKVAIAVSYRAEGTGTVFVVSGTGMMAVPGRADNSTFEPFNPRSSHWPMIRNLARAIAEQK